MNNSIKKKLCVVAAAFSALSFIGCGSEQPESAFDNPLPWHDAVSGSYEQLDYTVAVYDTTNGAAEDARTRIADGAVSFRLEEVENAEYTRVYMSFSVTYTADAPAPDAGLTDTIESSVEFVSNSLAVRSMHKELSLADRDGVENRSYVIDADYFDTHKATYRETRKENAAERTISLPQNTCHDNEMMFYLARAQGVGSGSSTMFRMINVFDSVNTGSLVRYEMVAAGSESKSTVDLGDWVSAFGVAAVTDEATGATSYPISCYTTTISINEEKHGPPYIVQYSEKPFKQGSREHGKIPVRISYSEYHGSAPRRYTEYTLSSCSFTKPQ